MITVPFRDMMKMPCFDFEISYCHRVNWVSVDWSVLISFFCSTDFSDALVALLLLRSANQNKYVK